MGRRAERIGRTRCDSIVRVLHPGMIEFPVCRDGNFIHGPRSQIDTVCRMCYLPDPEQLMAMLTCLPNPAEFDMAEVAFVSRHYGLSVPTRRSV